VVRVKEDLGAPRRPRELPRKIRHCHIVKVQFSQKNIAALIVDIEERLRSLNKLCQLFDRVVNESWTLFRLASSKRRELP
jgi:hypothetical protein